MTTVILKHRSSGLIGRMKNIVPDLIIFSIIIITLVAANFLSYIVYEFVSDDSNEGESLGKILSKHKGQFAWLLRLTVNCLGYACVFVPLYLIYKYTKKIKYVDRADNNFVSRIIRLCYSGERGERISSKNETSQSFKQDCALFCYCFSGLMVTYLTWGLLQEKIMTQEYVGPEDKKSHFTDSQFLVFINRLLALMVSVIYLMFKREMRHPAPLFKYSYASFSNVMSAWSQYEALKFVNFPTQVLAKSTKIIPVMIMGKIISRTKYEFHEYLTAVMISVGMVLFLTGSTDESKHTPATTLTGLFLLLLYLVFDSFTSNWQGYLSKNYAMTSVQMMFGINMFSTLFTSMSLLLQGGFMLSIDFALEHPKFIIDCIILSICAAVGQLFIYYTISKFGPVVFTIIMTLRQAIAILLSCVIYQHNISGFGVFGIVVVFLAVFLRFYGNHRLKQIRKKAETSKANFKPRTEV